MRVLLTENIHKSVQERFVSQGFEVDLITKALSEAELLEIVGRYEILGIRSKTRLTEKIFSKAEKLKAVGCFCIGTDQVDLEVAKKLGIPVFNAPFSNTHSVVELVIAQIISLGRRLFEDHRNMQIGAWRKSADNKVEIRGKTLGIVGYGNIGKEVGLVASALGMKVLFYDILPQKALGNSLAVNSLSELLKQSDFVTLHVPETPLTIEMMGPGQIAHMKKGSFLINTSRGRVVDIKSLQSALESGHLAGCALDVFPEEPSSNINNFHSPLQQYSNALLTPHIGGSTEQAQLRVGEDVYRVLMQYLQTGLKNQSVNFVSVS